MDQSYTYQPETAEAFFSNLEKALCYMPDVRRTYNAMAGVFRLLVDQQTAQVGRTLVGTFAKTDWLLRQRKASRELCRMVSDTRHRLRRRKELSDGELLDNHRHDFMTIALFTSELFATNVPTSIAAHFPGKRMKPQARRLLLQCMRVIVESWDDEYITARPDNLLSSGTEQEDSDSVRVCYISGNLGYDFDWSYLRDIISEGTQLNLVRPRMEDGILYPELIIVEPDCLIDISTVASGFTNYAESPIVGLLRKIEPQELTEAIVLGNLAGQLLDDEVHHPDGSLPYAHSAREFFYHNAMSLMTAATGQGLHQAAMQQKANIHRAFSEVLPTAAPSYDSHRAVLEPSFFSEMLGLQGRMDFLQADMSILMEQKSGKCGFPQRDPSTPVHKTEHYVQMLLYMLIIRYNYPEAYKRNGGVNAFLLYSRYPNSLLGLGFAPELVFRAIRLRNRIAASELSLASEEGFSLLQSLTPESVNEKKCDSRLWKEWQLPRFAQLLAPIAGASDLERTYYLRMLRFVAREHILSKLGNRTKENSGFASKWHDSLEDKIEAGNIYDRLTVTSPATGFEGRISHVTLALPETVADTANFRIGDIVILYPYELDAEPDARRTMVFRGSIENITDEQLVIRLRAPQTDAWLFHPDNMQEARWAVEHDFMESSYNSLYRGLHAFLSAPRQRRDLILLQRPPVTDHSLALRGDYGTFNDLSLRVRQARDLFLIIGPPGTGKTSFGMLNTVREELFSEDSSVLVTAYTNRAVDEICSKLSEEGISFIRIGSAPSCPEQYRKHLLETHTAQCANIGALSALIESTRVFVGTTTSLSSSQLLRHKRFSLAVIDEASQILEPHLMALLSARSDDGLSAIGKIVMIGDHKQLPAVVQQIPRESAVTEPALNAIHLTDCRLSLFERLLARYGSNPEVTYMLTHQGRMHHDIAAFSSQNFYGGLLREVPLPHQQGALPSYDGTDDLRRAALHRRVSFIDVPQTDDHSSDKVNLAEAEAIANIAGIIREHEAEGFSPLDTIGIIVPYRNQISAVRSAISRLGMDDLRDITIDTVERYQGSQRKYIIYGFTVRRHYQLAFLTGNVFTDTDGTIVDRRLNVVLTRAREHLILLGNARLLSHNTTFANLIAFAGSLER